MPAAERSETGAAPGIACTAAEESASCCSAAQAQACRNPEQCGDGRASVDCVRAQEEMQKKVAKWQEPPQAKQTRVLPVPDMEPKKRRGGRRARKYKERYGLTDVRKVCSHALEPPKKPLLMHQSLHDSQR